MNESRCTQCSRRFDLSEDMDAIERPIICGPCVNKILFHTTLSKSVELNKGRPRPQTAKVVDKRDPRLIGLEGNAYYRELKKLNAGG